MNTSRPSSQSDESDRVQEEMEGVDPCNSRDDHKPVLGGGSMVARQPVGPARGDTAQGSSHVQEGEGGESGLSEDSPDSTKQDNSNRNASNQDEEEEAESSHEGPSEGRRVGRRKRPLNQPLTLSVRAATRSGRPRMNTPRLTNLGVVNFPMSDFGFRRMAYLILIEVVGKPALFTKEEFMAILERVPQKYERQLHSIEGALRNGNLTLNGATHLNYRWRLKTYLNHVNCNANIVDLMTDSEVRKALIDLDTTCSMCTISAVRNEDNAIKNFQEGITEGIIEPPSSFLRIDGRPVDRDWVNRLPSVIYDPKANTRIYEPRADRCIVLHYSDVVPCKDSPPPISLDRDNRPYQLYAYPGVPEPHSRLYSKNPIWLPPYEGPKGTPMYYSMQHNPGPSALHRWCYSRRPSDLRTPRVMYDLRAPSSSQQPRQNVPRSAQQQDPQQHSTSPSQQRDLPQYRPNSVQQQAPQQNVSSPAQQQVARLNVPSSAQRSAFQQYRRSPAQQQVARQNVSGPAQQQDHQQHSTIPSQQQDPSQYRPSFVQQQASQQNVSSPAQHQAPQQNVSGPAQQQALRQYYSSIAQQQAPRQNVPSTSQHQAPPQNVHSVAQQRAPQQNVPSTSQHQAPLESVSGPDQQQALRQNVSNSAQQQALQQYYSSLAQQQAALQNVPSTAQHQAPQQNVSSRAQQQVAQQNVPSTSQHQAPLQNVSTPAQQQAFPQNVHSVAQQQAPRQNVPSTAQHQAPLQNVSGSAQQQFLQQLFSSPAQQRVSLLAALRSAPLLEPPSSDWFRATQRHMASKIPALRLTSSLTGAQVQVVPNYLTHEEARSIQNTKAAADALYLSDRAHLAQSRNQAAAEVQAREDGSAAPKRRRGEQELRDPEGRRPEPEN